MPAHGALGCKLVSLFCGIVFFSTLLRAQDETFRFEHLSVSHGLSQSTGMAIVQDRDGFIWIGTQDGLNKYDGRRFSVYRQQQDAPLSLRSNFIKALAASGTGELWVALERGLDKLKPDNGHVSHYDSVLAERFHLTGEFVVNDLLVDQRDRAWIASNQGLFRIGSTRAALQRFSVDTVGAASNNIRVLLQDRRANLWVGSADGRIFHVQEDVGSLIPVRLQLPENAPAPETITAMLEDRSGDLWCAVPPLGLLPYQPESGGLYWSLHQGPTDSRVKFDGVTALAEDKRGYIWVGTEDAGVSRLDPRTGIAVRLQNDPYSSESLSSNVVESLFVDDGGVVWIGTSGGGVNKFDYYMQKFRHVHHSLRHPDFLRGKFVWSVLSDSRGILWMGTMSGGLNRYDRQTGAYEVFMHENGNPRSLSSNTIYAIAEDARGSIWLGTPAGVNRLQPQSGEITRYEAEPNSEDSIPATAVRAVYRDSKDNLWFGTTGGGLLLYVPERDAFQTYRFTGRNSDSVNRDVVISIYEDVGGMLWLGTAGGLIRFDPQTAAFHTYIHSVTDANSLSNNHVMSVSGDTSGNLWIGTFYGLNRFDSRTGQWRLFTTADGLPNNVVYGVLVDGHDNIWGSTNMGLFKYDQKRQRFNVFDVDDGLQSLEFNGGACFKNSQGEMFFGGIDGVNIFHPDSVRRNPHVPEIVITRLKKFDRVAVVDPARQKTLALSYKDNFITFEFVALDFSNPAKNRYAYKLEGFHRDWISSGNQNYATFTNLAPGRYTFRVKGSNGDGVWNESGAQVHFTVLPPFWQTWWFRSLCVLLSASFVVGIIAYMRNKERQKAELSRRFAELKLQALRAQMNPHFVFNTINSIQYFISSDERTSAFEYLSKFSKLMRKMLENAEKSTVPLADELDSLRLYLQLESLRFEGKFEYAIHVDPGLDLHNTEVPTMLIQPFVENAIQHGLKFKRSHGYLDIRLHLVGQAIECLIEDNGIGIQKSLRLKSRQDNGHRSAGIKVTRQRLQTLNALKRNGKAIEIIDLSDAGSSRQGTRVKIIIPLNF